MKKLHITTGTILKLGSHIIGCGDSTDPAFVRKIIGKAKVRQVLTDPPYGIDYVASKEDFGGRKQRHASIENDHIQSDEEYRLFTRKWLEAAVPHLAAKNVIYCFNCDRMVFALREGMQDAGFRLSQLLVWVKTQPIAGRLDHHPQHELIAYGWHGVHERIRCADRTVLVHPKPHRSTFHPTCKPVALLRRLVLNGTRTGDIVYDPFLGSGSTLLACQETGRRCIGLELSPEYCRVVCERFEKATGIAAKVVTSPSRP
ncbi:MAG: site-specific DNA-methyltransferase [Candidatus Peribacteraceae bacterium]|nr:site-specific DNA-methyltransferase [Candidatus Peribacteraceae bacterium]MDD5742765.1 site-specific DNA-methyltransferase [Candidatus Peribacteraceae bacterium]